MIDFYLKFASEEEANAVLYTVIPEVLNEEGEVVSEEQIKPNFSNIDILGILYEPQAATGLTDEPVDPIPLDGWHVNVRVIDGEDATGLQQYAVVPSVPRRVWG